MTFIKFILALENKLGYHHIPVNREAKTLRDLFDGTAVQSDFVIKFVRAIYKKNHCTSLDANITKNITEDALATIRATSLKSQNMDIDTFNFIEDMCLAVSETFTEDLKGAQRTGQSVKDSNDKADVQDMESNVISIEHKRHRRWLKSSA